MSNIPFSLSHESVTIFLDGVPHTHHAGTVQYNQLRDALGRNADPSEFTAILAPGGALAKYLGSSFSVKDDKLFYVPTPELAVELPEGLTARIRGMADEGVDPSPMLRFYERLDKNPSFRSRTQLFEFMKHNNIAIEADGRFLAYKSVDEDYKDLYTHTIDNAPGEIVSMPRNQISDNPELQCHIGLHVGALSYVTGFAGMMGSSSKNVVAVRVDPEDVVCIPNDYNAQKMRVCRYEVVGNWNGEVLTSTDASELEDDSNEDDISYLDDDDGEDTYESGAAGDQDEMPDAPAPLQPVEIAVRVKSIPNYRLSDAKKLMTKPIEDLRLYASKRLKIAGASKISGGKAALVSKIMQVRRRRAKAGK